METLSEDGRACTNDHLNLVHAESTPGTPSSIASTRVCLRAHEGSHIISAAMTTIAR